MNFCTKCGSKFVEGGRFCQGCGAPRASGVKADDALLEYEGTHLLPRVQASVSQTGVTPQSFAGKQLQVPSTFTPVVVLSMLQIAAPLLWSFGVIVDGFSFEFLKSYLIPELVGGEIARIPFVLLAFAPVFREDIRVKVFAAVAAAVFGIQGVVAFGEEHWASGVSEAFLYLSFAAMLSGVGLTAVLFREVRFNKGHLAPVNERWRAALGFTAVLLLHLEFPGRVFSERWILLSLLVFPLVTGLCLLQEPYRQGAAAGLGVVVAGSIVSQMLVKVLSSYSYAPFLSLPQLLAVGCCLLALAPKTFLANLGTNRAPIG